MKKGLFVIPVAGAIATVVALGVASIKPWSWDNTAKDKVINYCLLIGQTDHNDSAARTGGIREKLGTRPLKHESNANVEKAKQGKLRFYSDTAKNQLIDTYTVNELESKVCISDSGATWDQQTAINISNTWYAKYPNKLTMMVSNNDGMAEGALFSSCRPDNMPIFGYDSNESTLKLINQNKITGTINSNAAAQAAAINILAKRIIDGDGTYDKDNIYGTLFKGLKGNVYKLDDEGNEVIDETESKKFKVKSDSDGDFITKGGYLTDTTKVDLEFSYKPYCHALLVSSKAVTKDNIDQFLDKDAAWQAANTNTVNTEAKSGKNYNFYQCCYSQTDTYLNSTMNPLVRQFRKQFNIADSELKSMVYGNGNDENDIIASIKQKNNIDAYIINMVKTVDANKYIDAIYTTLGNDDEKFKKTPIIFYNRQPTNADNTVDPTYLLPNEKTHYSNNIFYVGFDATSGAELQGTMIQDWLKDQVGAKEVEVVDE